jgi:SAM-dependent methyltransferase
MTSPNDFFDARAATWDDDPTKVERARRAAEAIRQAVPVTSGLAVLDYGCGTGLLGLALRPHLGRLVLADTSEGMLEVVRQKLARGGGPPATALRLDLSTGDPPQDLRVDLVCTLMAMHHVPDTRALLGRFHQLLRAPGTLCIVDLEQEDGSFHGPAVEVHHGFARGELTGLLTRAGFEEPHFSTVDTIVRVDGPGRRSYPLFLAVARKRDDRA